MRSAMQPSLRRQRFVVLAAICALVATVVFAPIGTPEKARAVGTVGCSPDGSTDVDRATLTLADGTVIHPCIARVNLHLSLTGGLGSFGINRIVLPEGGGTVPVKYVDGTTENLYHLTFQSFLINSGAKMTVHPSLGSTNPPYTLNLNPDNAGQIGGSGVNTDLWVTGSSNASVFFLLCVNFAVSTMASLSWLLNGTSWSGCNGELDVRYMTAYVPGGTTKNVFPLKLPNTSVSIS